jgi:hypothetical protein
MIQLLRRDEKRNFAALTGCRCSRHLPQQFFPLYRQDKEIPFRIDRSLLLTGAVLAICPARPPASRHVFDAAWILAAALIIGPGTARSYACWHSSQTP